MAPITPSLQWKNFNTLTISYVQERVGGTKAQNTAKLEQGLRCTSANMQWHVCSDDNCWPEILSNLGYILS